jgi:hypothetical protein
MKNRHQMTGAAEDEFARRLCARLDEGLGQLDDKQLDRLSFARKLALRAQHAPEPRSAAFARPALALAGRSLSFGGKSPGGGRIGLSLGVIAVVCVCLLGIFQVEQQRRIEELADIDSALLSDELPISAYADHGFDAYLKQNP